MSYRRSISKTLSRVEKFPVVAVVGPRQSGKTTITRMHFKNHAFVSFEDPFTRELALNDPRRFLEQHENKHGIILDEFQYVPQILSYIQLEVDEKRRPGYFVLTGSHNFLMNQAITQSLAGRVGIVTLLPLSLQELTESGLITSATDIDTAMFRGCYARPYFETLDYIDFYSGYVFTYVERDVRQIINVEDLGAFQKFLRLCAGRIGQLLDLTDLATNCGVSVPTAQRWITLLEASYIIFLLQPHFTNFNKRLTKTPKLFFYDTGLACHLLGINSPNTLSLNPLRGNIFESFMISDFKKQFFNNGRVAPLYFWRDKNGRLEVDCIVDLGNKLVPIEIKSSHTPSLGFFSTLIRWDAMAETQPEDNYVVYAGKENRSVSKGHLVGWRSTGNLMDELQARQAELEQQGRIS